MENEYYDDFYEDSHNRFILNLLGIKTELNTIPYKNNNDREKHSIDCTTRAFATLFDIGYTEILKIQHEVAFSLELAAANVDSVIKAILNSHGFVDTEIPEMLVSAAEFMYTRKTGTYAIVTNEHIFAYIDGVWYDNEQVFNYADCYLTEHIRYVYKKEEAK